MVVIQREINDTIENEIEKLNETFLDLKNRASEVRKQGKDTFMLDITMIDFLPKLKMAKNTYDKKDLLVAKKIIENIKKELEIIEKGSNFDHIKELISDAFEKIRHEKFKEAKLIYRAIIKIYKILSKDEQKVFYKACFEIKSRLEKSKK